MTDQEYYLCHYQIKGAKHGVRRWQNKDGSLTPAGRLRYLKNGTRKRAGTAIGDNKQPNGRQPSQGEKKYTTIGTASRISKMALRDPKIYMKLSKDLTVAVFSDYAGTMKYCKTTASLPLRHRDRYLKVLNKHLDNIKDDLGQVKVDKQFFTRHKNDTVDDILNDGNSAMVSYMIMTNMATNA